MPTGEDERVAEAALRVSPQGELLVELARRQPLLAAINLATALLCAAAFAEAVPVATLAGWLGAMALTQTARLGCWWRWRGQLKAGRLGSGAAPALAATSGASGLVWGLIGVAFVGSGSAAERMLVPFFLAGMAAGAVPTLAGHPLAFHCFLVSILLPYATQLWLEGEPVMSLSTLAYGVGLGALALEAHRLARRRVELLLENARLVDDLEESHRDLERRVQQRSAELQTVMDTVPVAIWLVHDPQARRVTGSRHANEMLRLQPGSNMSLSAPEKERPRHFRILRDGRELVVADLPIQRAVRGEIVRGEELRVVFEDGSFHDELFNAAPVRDASGVITGAVGAAVDITGRKRVEEALRRSEQRFRDFAAAASDWFWETDAEHRFVWMSANVQALTGVPPEWHYGKTRLELMGADADPALLEAHRQDLEARRPFRDLEFLRQGPGSDAWVSTSGVPILDAEGRFLGYRGVGREISDRKRAEERIRHLALHDELTGLPNRHLLQDRLRQALALAQRGDARVALLLLDLDRFKDVNDTLGHPAGDLLLRSAAERLKVAVRGSDTLARLGGDEFAVVQTALRNPHDVAVLAHRLIEVLAAPFLVGGQEVHVGASVGIAVHPEDGVDPDELIRRADLALYRAKHDGGGRFRFFETAMDTEARSRRKLERELRQALDRGEFVLHYQPQLDLATGHVAGVEALVRWRHPERGLVAPGEFVPLAEACGLILRLGVWVLGEACRQARAWRDAGLRLAVAVNLSPAELRQGGVLHATDSALRRHGLGPGSLELEITESLLLEGLGSVTDRTLRGLAARRIGLALDDFGTGYSSLAYLKRLPVDKIKIDRSFVRDIGSDPEHEALVRAIVTLGHALGKVVVAEGVETEAQLAFLRRLRCDSVQGFLLARPQDAADLTPFLAAAARRDGPVARASGGLH